VEKRPQDLIGEARIITHKRDCRQVEGDILDRSLGVAMTLGRGAVEHLTAPAEPQPTMLLEGAHDANGHASSLDDSALWDSNPVRNHDKPHPLGFEDRLTCINGVVGTVRYITTR
jgi:hypothetical protein